MALKAQSLFLYGFRVTTLNRHIDFVGEVGGPVLTATLSIGFYSLTSLMAEMVRAMASADLDNSYAVTADRTYDGGTENRVTITSSGDHFELRFGTGPSGTSLAPLIGFALADRTGSLTYTGVSSSGTAVITPYSVNSWIHPSRYKKTTGNVNTTASGKQEAIIYGIQRYWQLSVVWISDVAEWEELLTWLTQKMPVDFTPEITSPNVYFEGTLESTPQDSNGLSFMLNESPKGSDLYETGTLKFRVIE